jgi:DNA-binding transcriptional ArsR family regulator
LATLRDCCDTHAGDPPLNAGEADINGLADLFSQASDPTRLRLLIFLLAGEKCVCDLSGAAGVSMSAASHSLRLLRASGLVVPRRDGRHIYYRLADDHVRVLLSIGVEHVRERSGSGGGRI